MKKKFRIKPDYGTQEDITFLRKKLTEIVTRMKRDYERELKPLIKRIEKESRKSKKETEEKIEEILKTDSVKYLNPFEASRIVHCLKSEIEDACRTGKIEGAVNTTTGWIIPEDSAYEYGVQTGRIESGDKLFDKFFKKVKLLQKKYDDMTYMINNFVNEFTRKTFQNSRKKFKKQFGKIFGIDVLDKLTERGLKEEFDLQVNESVNLIKTLPKKYFDKIEELVVQSVSGDKDFEGGLIDQIQELTKTTRNKAKLISRDQSAKAVSSVNSIRYRNLGSEKYIWHCEMDSRVAGNPNGLYPNVDDNSKYHGNHWKREGKVFSWDNPPPDGHPGMPINCRCYAEPIFDDL